MKLKELEKKSKAEILEAWKKNRKTAKILFILLIIMAGYCLIHLTQDRLSTKDKLLSELNCQKQLNTYFINQTNTSISQFKKELCAESSITQTINTFFDNFLMLDKPWIIKLLVFLGVVYLIQITFALVMDIMEVIILIFVLFKRIYVWIRSKFKKFQKD